MQTNQFSRKRLRVQACSLPLPYLASFFFLIGFIFLIAGNAHSARVDLNWSPNSEPDLSGYKIYYGKSSGDYEHYVDVGNRTDLTVSDLEAGEVYYFAASAYDKDDNESELSEEIAAEARNSADGSDPKNWTDYRVMLTMKSFDNDALGIMFRYQDAENYYRFSWDRQRLYRRLVECQDGEFKLLAEDSEPYEPERPYELEIVADGDVLEVLIDGALVFSVLNESLSKGGMALYSWGNEGAVFDDVTVSDLATEAILMKADFESGSLAGWSRVDGGDKAGPSAWAISSGMLMQNSNIYSNPIKKDHIDKLGTHLAFGGDSSSVESASWADYRATVKMASGDDDALGIMFRYQDPDNYYRFSWDSEEASRGLVKCEEGKIAVLAEDYEPYELGRAYEVEIVADGRILEVIIDGSLIFSVSDESLAAGGIALWSWSEEGSLFDDVVVGELSTGKTLLYEGFEDGSAENWTVFDEGSANKSEWIVLGGVLIQSSNRSSHSRYEIRRLTDKSGSYALYNL